MLKEPLAFLRALELVSRRVQRWAPRKPNHQVKRGGVGVLSAWFCSKPRVQPPYSNLPYSQVPFQDGEDRIEALLAGGSVDEFFAGA